MEKLEEIARLEWDLLNGQPGWVQKEFVALGFIAEDGSGSAEDVWYQLENVADPSIAALEGRGEFFVEGEELRRVVELASAEGHGEKVRMLWHTHTATASPSAEDIAEFPAWLADYGMVYHVPSGKTTLYNAAGVISNSDQPAIALSTEPSDG